jgi:virginiamycin B lyase
VTVSLDISPQEPLGYPVSIVTANTVGSQTLSITPQQTLVTVDKPQTVKVTISADNFAMPGTYQILVGARYQDVTVSKYINVTLE